MSAYEVETASRASSSPVPSVLQERAGEGEVPSTSPKDRFPSTGNPDIRDRVDSLGKLPGRRFPSHPLGGMMYYGKSRFRIDFGSPPLDRSSQLVS